MEKSVALLNMNGLSEKVNNIENQDILFYDHECIMCSHFVGFIKKLHPSIFFSNIHSKDYDRLNLNTNIDSVVFYFSGNTYIKSNAILMLLIHSNSKKWRFFGRIFKWIPKWIRDTFYDIVARNRRNISKLLFKKNYCDLSINKID